VADSLGSKLNYGPSLKINFNLQNVNIIKTMSNSHDFKHGWSRMNEKLDPTPQISYSFNLTLVLLPNIQLNNYETIVFVNNGLADFQSISSIVVNF
jgi:hypothetical protein